MWQYYYKLKKAIFGFVVQVCRLIYLATPSKSSNSPDEPAFRYTGRECCGGQGIEIELGVYSNYEFRKLMVNCFDKNSRRVIYSCFEMHPPTEEDQNMAKGRPSSSPWREDDFYELPVHVDQLYRRVHQRASINRQLGLAADNTKYIKDTDNLFLTKGHLTPSGDIYGHQRKRATFFYINSVPQWQTFNGGNWEKLESVIRQLSIKMRLNLQILTGSHGIITLPHEETGNLVPLYLYYNDESGNCAIPIPEILYKVIYCPSKLQGVVIVGVNNPYKVDISSCVYCKDVADELGWLKLDRKNIHKGYIYACSIPEFSEIFPHLPIQDLDVSNGLLN